MADNTAQRRAVAQAAVQFVTNIADALYELQKLADQVSKFTSPFADSDFAAPAANTQLSAGILNVFFNNVLPALQAVYHDNAAFAGTGNQVYTPDATNLGRNEQIMLQMRAG